LIVALCDLAKLENKGQHSAFPSYAEGYQSINRTIDTLCDWAGCDIIRLVKASSTRAAAAARTTRTLLLRF
jgi:hypothetical protein